MKRNGTTLSDSDGDEEATVDIMPCAWTHIQPVFDPFEDALNSGTLTFVVGQDKKEFQIHKSIVSLLSPALDALVKGSVEKGEEHVEWLDVAADVFACFVRYAYTGNYIEAQSVTLESCDELCKCPSDVDRLGIPSKSAVRIHAPKRAKSSNGADNRTTKTRMEDRFWRLGGSFTPKGVHAGPLRTYGFVRNRHRGESFEPIFINHARVYLLANKYEIEGLKNLALYRLYRSLNPFTVWPERVAELTCLAEVLYQGTTKGDVARELISSYLACVMEHVRFDEKFLALIGRQADFTADLLDALSRYLD